MKKLSILAITALIASSCSESSVDESVTPDAKENNRMVVSAGITPSRSVLNGLATEWVSGDAISVISDESSIATRFDIISDFGANSSITSAEFEGDKVEGAIFYAFYPHANGLAVDSDKLDFTLSATQTHTAASFASGAMPAFGSDSDITDGVDFSFTNICGVLRLNLTKEGESVEVSRIVVSAEDYSLSGEATYTLGEGVATMGDSSNDSVTLTCDEVSLDAITSASFDIVLPPVTAKLTIQIYGKGAYDSEEKMLREVTISHPSIEANVIKNIATFAITDSSVAPSTDGSMDIADITSSSYPTGEEWTVKGGSSITAAAGFTNLIAAMNDAYSKNGNKPISLIFTELTTIPASAFYPSTTSTISLGAVSSTSVLSVEMGGLRGATNLTSVNLPNANSIGNTAFNGCSKLTSIFLPAATSIGQNTFQNCSLLADVSLPKVTSFGNGPFASTPKLARVEIGTATQVKITSWGSNLFNSATMSGATLYVGSIYADNVNSKVFTADKAYTFGDVAVGDNTSNPLAPIWEDNDGSGDNDDTSFSFSNISASNKPSGTTWTITGDTWNSNLITALTEAGGAINLILPDLTELPEGAFATKGEGTSYITSNLLASISAPNVLVVNNHAFRNNKSLVTVDMDAVTSIGNYAFSGCNLIEELFLPEVTTTGVESVNACTKLKYISMPKVTSLGNKTLFNVGTGLVAVELATESNIATYGTQLFQAAQISSVSLYTKTSNSFSGYTFGTKNNQESALSESEWTNIKAN